MPFTLSRFCFHFGEKKKFSAYGSLYGAYLFGSRLTMRKTSCPIENRLLCLWHQIQYRVLLLCWMEIQLLSEERYELLWRSIRLRGSPVCELFPKGHDIQGEPKSFTSEYMLYFLVEIRSW